MANQRRILRSFLYLNEDIVDDYLSEFEGSIIEGSYTTKDTTSRGKEGGLGANVAGFSGSGKGNTASSSETQQTMRETFAAKFTRLYNLLDEEKLIQSLNGFDLAVYEEIQAGEIVEVRGIASLPKWEHLMEEVSGLSGLMDVMKTLGIDPFDGNSTSSAAYTGFTTLIDKKSKEDTKIIIAPIGSPNIKFVASLDSTHLRRKKVDLEAEVTLLGKVISKLGKNETIDLFRLAPRLDQLQQLNRVQRRGTNKKKAQGTDSPLDEVVKYPALQVRPIAIYQ